MEKEETLRLGKTLFLLLSHYLEGEQGNLEIPEKDIDPLLGLASSNGILLTTYLALKSQGIVLGEEKEAKLNGLLSMNIRKTVLFEKEREKLYSFLDENGIAYMPLKGILFNALYKDYGSRQFADNDILFDSKYAKEVKRYFLDNDYEVEFYGKGYHDAYQKKPFFNFEMHRELFEGSVNDPIIQGFLKYFKGYLEKGKPVKGYERALSKEDGFVYFMAHFYKHISESGSGARSLLDIEVYLRKYPDLDWDYIYGEFKKINLDGFVKESLSLVKHLFDGDALSQEEEGMFINMLSNGLYGNKGNLAKHAVSQEGSKAKYIFRRIFPRMSFYKSYYPWFYKTKVFIPLAWFLRLFHVFKKRKALKEELKGVKEAE